MMDVCKKLQADVDWNTILCGAISLNHKRRRKLIKKIKRSCRRKALAIADEENCKSNDKNNTSSSESDNDLDDGRIIGPQLPKVIDYSLYFTQSPPRSILKKSADSVDVCDTESLLENSNKDVSQSAPASSPTDDGQLQENHSNQDVSSSPLCIANAGISNPENNQDNKSENEAADSEIKDAAIAKLLKEIDEEVSQWHNPYEPTTSKPIVRENIVTAKTTPYVIPMEVRSNTKDAPKEICNFYEKVGSCRFGERCSRLHKKPLLSDTILLRGMFTTFAFEILQRAKRNFHGDMIDLSLEHSDDDLYDEFVEFTEDVLPELETYGKVLQFKVCCNREAHLVGNVYVQFQTEEEASNALGHLNGRFYSGKCLTCEFVKIQSWKAAICGLHYHKRVCPRGHHCNFLHVFKHPSRRFRNIDMDATSPKDLSRSFKSTSSRRGNGKFRDTSRSPKRRHHSYGDSDRRYYDDNEHRRWRSRSPISDHISNDKASKKVAKKKHKKKDKKSRKHKKRKHKKSRSDSED